MSNGRAQYFFLPEHLSTSKSFVAATGLHGALFFILGAVGVQHAEYSIATGTTAVDVQLVASGPEDVAPPSPQSAMPEIIDPVPPDPEFRALPVKMKQEEISPPVRKKKTAPIPKPVAKAAPAAPHAAADRKPGEQAAPSTGGGSSNPDPQAANSAEPRGVDLRAAYFRNPPPAYPSASRRSGEEGLVLLSVVIDASGNVADLSLKRSSGYARLDNAALKTVKKWVFNPMRIAGIPTADTVEVPIRFALKRSGGA